MFTCGFLLPMNPSLCTFISAIIPALNPRRPHRPMLIFFEGGVGLGGKWIILMFHKVMKIIKSLSKIPLVTPVHPGEGSSSVALLKVSSLFSP